MISADKAETAVPVDLEHLRRFTLGDAALEQEILGLFISHAPETLGVLQAAANAVEWRAAAHGLKGSARAVGAQRVAELAALAESGYPEDEGERQQQLATLGAAIETARDYIAQLHPAVLPRKA
jgi:HPt (histidine-containing phosphotransfer) domain-containing protein